MIFQYFCKIFVPRSEGQPLTEKTTESSAFVTPDGLFEYTLMPFGMKNSPATFQRLVNKVISRLNGVRANIDDVIIYST